MRVVHLITRLDFGGAQQNTLHTCRELGRRGHDVILVAGPGGMLDDEARASGVRYFPLPRLRREIRPFSDIMALRDVVAMLRRERPDVLHTHSSKAGALGRLAGRLARVPVVIHSVHGWAFAPRMPAAPRILYRIVEAACTPLADHVISVSRRDLDTGRALGLVREGRASVIRSGIALGDFSPHGPGRDRVRAEWGVGASDILVVSVANLKPQKGPLDFVAAAALAAREVPHLRFAFIGDGELRPRVEEAIAAAGLAGRFVLPGWRRDVPEILRAADIFALSSLWEGLPRSVVQARASGLPVVATAVNGTPEAVLEGECGYLVPPGDPAAMAAALVRLARDPDRRRAMAAKALEGLEEFSDVTMVDAQEALYSRLLAERRARA